MTIAFTLLAALQCYNAIL